MTNSLRRSLASLSLTIAFASASIVSTRCQAADLTVDVTGIRDDRGLVDVTIYRADGWLNDSRAVVTLSLPAHPGTVRAVFHQLKPGCYAIATMHDENGDGQMDFDFLGLPTEGYAFSRDVRPFLAAPSFDRAAFTVGNAALTLRIRMVYPLAGLLVSHRH